MIIFLYTRQQELSLDFFKNFFGILVFNLLDPAEYSTELSD